MHGQYITFIATTLYTTDVYRNSDTMTIRYLVLGNEKLKNSSGSDKIVVGWGIGAGSKTCPCAGACRNGCYALSGRYLFANVKAKNYSRLALSESDQFIPVIDSEIKEIIGKNPDKVVYVRIHDSGDFYNMAYAQKWFSIMRNNPDVKFYAYTKMVEMFQSLTANGGIPENFKLIMSYGGTQDNLIRDTDTHAKVFENMQELTAAGYIDCSHDDLLVFTTNKVGLTYHGNKKWENTGFINIE